MTITQAMIDRLRRGEWQEWSTTQKEMDTLFDAAERSLAQEAEHKKWVAAHQIDTDAAWRKARAAELESEALRAQVAQLREALSHIKWVKDCGIDGRNEKGDFVNFTAQERDSMYQIADDALNASMPDEVGSGPSQEGTAGPEAPKPCNEVRPGNGFCDMCAAGLYERCRYVVPHKQLDAIRAAEIRGMEMAATIVDRVYLSGDIARLIRSEIARLKEGA